MKGQLHYRAELVVGDLAVAVPVRVDDRLVYDLLELGVLEVVANHHLEHLEQLSIGDEAVPVYVVDLECNCVCGEGGWVAQQTTVYILITLMS